MDINSGIFKAYDIRGVYPTELNEEAVRAIARAVISETKAKTLALGRDMRVSSPALFTAFSQEAVRLGVVVDDVGLCPTEMIYYISGQFDYDANVIITASHNPAEYNGMKTLRRKADFIRGTMIGEWVKAGQTVPPQTGGQVREVDRFSSYIAHVLAQVDQAALKPLKIVVDAGNGMAGKVIPALQTSLPFTIIPLYFELDGRFPNRPSNPLAPGALDVLKKKVVEAKADAGVAFDGDCDRVFFIDEQGQFIQADMTLLLIAEQVLRRNPGKTIVYNAICSRAVPEFVKEMNGQSWRTPVGYANVRKGMLEHDGVLGGEVSAHYAFPENFFTDSGFIAFLKVMELLSRSDQPLSALVSGFQKYVRLDEVNFKVPDVQAELQKIRSHFKDLKQDELDGVTVWHDDWWVNVRPSNTEPLLRVTLEGKTKEMAEEKLKEVLSVLGQ